MRIKNLKKAVGQYQNVNKGGHFSPWYGFMMIDRETGELWVDEFYQIGHTTWNEYHKSSIVNLINWARAAGYDTDIEPVNMHNVKLWAEEACEQWETEKH